MDDCELTGFCATFYDRLANMPSTARLMKGAYCKGKHLECARYIVYKEHGRENVPVDLYPSDFDSAKALIRPSLSY